MTGRRAAGSAAWVHTFTVSQSSSVGWGAGPYGLDCGGGEPNEKASRTPSHAVAGRGSANRARPVGGCANGMPRKTARPPSRRPRTRPAVVRASGSAGSRRAFVMATSCSGPRSSRLLSVGGNGPARLADPLGGGRGVLAPEVGRADHVAHDFGRAVVGDPPVDEQRAGVGH